MMSAHEGAISKVSYEDLADLEKEFEGAELEICQLCPPTACAENTTS